MKLTAKARYALRILLDIAQNATEEKPRTLKEISEEQGIGEKFVSRLVLNLRDAGMITAARGRVGGYRLAKKPKDITLLEIIEVAQGPICVVECLGEKACERALTCAPKIVWSEVNEAIRSSLKTVTLKKVLSK